MRRNDHDPVGTRASLLARAQGAIVGAALCRALGVEIELVDVASAGDDVRPPLTEIGGQGVFVSAVREAVIDGDVDLVVHSLKDLPTTDDERVQLAAVPVRGDVRDALVARDGLTLGELPAGSRVGTGSPRRAAQLLALGLGLDVVPIRGNVDTRLEKVHAGDLDGVVLARAGLSRIGREDEITETIDPIQMLPAPGQGALAVEVAASASVLADQVRAALDDAADARPRSPPSGSCFACWRPGAVPRSAPWPRWPRVTTVRRCGCAVSWLRSTAATPFDCRPRVTRVTRPPWAVGWRRTCSPRARPV